MYNIKPLSYMLGATSIGSRGSIMLRIALWVCGAAIGLYLAWNFLQILIGAIKERRSNKSTKADGPT